MDGRRLDGNALAWTTRGKTKPRVAVLREAGVAGFFRELGCADVRVVADVPARDTAAVLVATGFRAADVDAAVAFVEAGGGLLNTSLGWGYLYFNREAKLSFMLFYARKLVKHNSLHCLEYLCFVSA